VWISRTVDHWQPLNIDHGIRVQRNSNLDLDVALLRRILHI
jgi:hypothetical protein